MPQPTGNKSNTNLFVNDTEVSATNLLPIDVIKMTKGSVITVIDDVSETTLSDEFDTRNYTAIYVHVEITSGTWDINSLGSDVSGGTFVNQYLAYTLLKCPGLSVSRGYVCPTSPNYMKIKATLVTDTGEIKITVTPVVIGDIEVPPESLTHFHRQFLNETYGDDMAQNAGGAGAIRYSIYAEDVEWSTSAISGIWDFASTDQSHGGSKSVDGTATIDGDIAEFDAGSSQDLTGSKNLVGWIYLSTVPPLGEKALYIYGWASGSIVGNTVNILDYIDTAVLGSWQVFLIPLIDFDLIGESIDAIRIEQYGLPASKVVSFYLDDIYVDDGTGTIIEYSVEPEDNTELVITHIGIYICSTEDSTLANATIPNISCGDILGVSLTNGIRYHVEIDGIIVDDDTIYNLSDFMILMDAHIVNQGGNASSLWLYMEHEIENPINLKASTSDHIMVEIRDNLSSLTKMVMTAGGGIRNL